MKGFDKYVIDWFNEFLDDNSSDNDCFIQNIFNAMGYTFEDLGEDEEPLDFLLNLDPEEIYSSLISGADEISRQDLHLPSCESFLKDMFKSVVYSKFKSRGRIYCFVDEFLDDMAGNALQYDNPKGFFEDLQCGGCSSGIVGMLIYNSDCKKIYVDNIDEMEDVVCNIKEEIGEIRDNSNLPRYVFVCWLCYEELGWNIYSCLFE